MTAQIYIHPTAREIANELGDKDALATLDREAMRRVIRGRTARVLVALFFLNASALVVAAWLGDLRASLFFAVGMAAAAVTRAFMGEA